MDSLNDSKDQQTAPERDQGNTDSAINSQENVSQNFEKEIDTLATRVHSAILDHTCNRSNQLACIMNLKTTELIYALLINVVLNVSVVVGQGMAQLPGSTLVKKLCGLFGVQTNFLKTDKSHVDFRRLCIERSKLASKIGPSMQQTISGDQELRRRVNFIAKDIFANPVVRTTARIVTQASAPLLSKKVMKVSMIDPTGSVMNATLIEALVPDFIHDILFDIPKRSSLMYAVTFPFVITMKLMLLPWMLGATLIRQMSLVSYEDQKM